MPDDSSAFPAPQFRLINGTGPASSPAVSTAQALASTSDYYVTGEQALWRAVITQALMDAGSTSTRLEAKVARAQAIAWFTRRNRDLQTVCSLAGLDVEYVLGKAKEALKRRCEWRKK